MAPNSNVLKTKQSLEIGVNQWTINKMDVSVENMKQCTDDYVNLHELISHKLEILSLVIEIVQAIKLINCESTPKFKFKFSYIVLQSL